MSSPSQQERILNLLALLLHADKPVPFHVIYAQLEGYSDLGMDSARRSFTRDIHTMRELGVPIFYVEHQDVDSGGYEIPKDYYYLPRIDLTEPEKAIVSQISWMTEKSMKSPLFRALYKLNYDSPFENEFAPKISAAAEHDDPVISKLSSFIAHGKTIQFDYQTVASDQESGRVIDPYGLGYYQNHWYLVGFCHRRKAIRCFKVARILGGRFQTYNKRVERDFQIPQRV
jgi:proteasome accessory factor B